MTTSPYVSDFNPAAFRRKRYDDLRAALDSGVSGTEGGIKAYDTENAAKEKEDYLRGVKKTEMDLESKRVAMNQAREDRIAAGATPRKGLGALQDALDAERLKKLQTENDDLPPDPSKDNSVDMAQAFSEAANPSSAPPATGPARLRDAATKRAPADDTPPADAVVNPAPSADVESALNNFDTITAPAFQGTGKAPESVDEKIKDQKLITATNKNKPKAAANPNAPKSAKQRKAEADATVAEAKAAALGSPKGATEKERARSESVSATGALVDDIINLGGKGDIAWGTQGKAASELPVGMQSKDRQALDSQLAQLQIEIPQVFGHSTRPPAQQELEIIKTRILPSIHSSVSREDFVAKMTDLKRRIKKIEAIESGALDGAPSGNVGRRDEGDSPAASLPSPKLGW